MGVNQTLSSSGSSGTFAPVGPVLHQPMFSVPRGGPISDGGHLGLTMEEMSDTNTGSSLSAFSVLSSGQIRYSHV